MVNALLPIAEFRALTAPQPAGSCTSTMGIQRLLRIVIMASYNKRDKMISVGFKA